MKKSTAMMRRECARTNSRHVRPRVPAFAYDALISPLRVLWRLIFQTLRCRNAVLLASFLDWNVEGNRVHDAQALELHPDAVHAGTRKCHVELDVLLGTT